MTLALRSLAPFARGGNRLCFVHPLHSDRCIKVRRPDFTLADLRRSKGFPKNLRPLSWFDDNREEFEVMHDIAHRLGEPALALVSRCHGFEDTDLGAGLTSELIRDGDGRIARTLKQHLWDNGYSPMLQAAVARFGAAWAAVGVPSRDLLVHNLVVQCAVDGSVRRLVAIDGLGSPGIIPERWLPRSFQRARAARKVANLQTRINDLLAARARNEFPGTHGLLMHDGQLPASEKSPE